jgi:hypothetical protein
VSRTHDEKAAGGADDGAPTVDWWQVLDIAVWVAVALIVAIAAEWLIGSLVRERIARGAQRYLRKEAAETEAA